MARFKVILEYKYIEQIEVEAEDEEDAFNVATMSSNTEVFDTVLHDYEIREII